MTKSDIEKEIQDLAELYHLVLVKKYESTSSTSRSQIQFELLSRIYFEKFKTLVDKLK